jgi:hypothetical protein
MDDSLSEDPAWGRTERTAAAAVLYEAQAVTLPSTRRYCLILTTSMSCGVSGGGKESMHALDGLAKADSVAVAISVLRAGTVVAPVCLLIYEHRFVSESFQLAVATVTSELKAVQSLQCIMPVSQ